jgi:hypothetical protein
MRKLVKQGWVPRAGALALFGSMLALMAPLPATAAPSGTGGDFISAAPLPSAVTLPGSVDAKRFTYWSSTAGDKPAVASGAIYLPPGKAPAGGWPVVAWAHGTTGLADQCAYSIGGPIARERDWAYLGTWLKQGYAIVAADYAGLGTAGNHPYLNGIVEAHNVVDGVKAATRHFAGVLSRRWVAIGQSQGGSAAAFTARYATQFGAPELDFRGGVATGMPGHIEDTLLLMGPHVPPIALGGGTTAYTLYMLSGLRTTYPELDLNSYLTPTGRRWVDRGEQACEPQLAAEITAAHLPIGDLLAKPLASLPDARALLTRYLGTPESGYDRPLFIGQGLTDTDIVLPGTLATVVAMRAAGQPIAFHAYPSDHSETVNLSLPDSIPFVRNLFR